MSTPDGPAGVLAEVVRTDGPAVRAALARRLGGDLGLADDAFADAVVEALRSWGSGQVPDNPAGWLVGVGARRGLDRLRRTQVGRRKAAELAALEAVGPGPPAGAGAGFDDDLLAMLFACCHPALARPSQLALVLHHVLGLPLVAVARALCTSEAAAAQRLARARRKVREAGCALAVPDGHALVARIDGVARVVGLLLTEGLVTSAGEDVEREDLVVEATRLADALVRTLPDEAEALALAGLCRLHAGRRAARFSPEGDLVLLGDQDRGRWDRALLDEGVALLERALARRTPGRVQLEAAVVAVHVAAPSADATDWPQVLALYDRLAEGWPSPVVALNRAVAVAEVHGAAAGLDALAAVGDLRSHLVPAVRGELLARLGRRPEAAAAVLDARARTTNAAERRLLDRRLAALGGPAVDAPAGLDRPAGPGGPQVPVPEQG